MIAIMVWNALVLWLRYIDVKEGQFQYLQDNWCITKYVHTYVAVLYFSTQSLWTSILFNILLRFYYLWEKMCRWPPCHFLVWTLCFSTLFVSRFTFRLCLCHGVFRQVLLFNFVCATLRSDNCCVLTLLVSRCVLTSCFVFWQVNSSKVKF